MTRAIEVVCPTCDARPGVPCTWPDEIDHIRVSVNHQRRSDEAARTTREKNRVLRKAAR